jgi:hypothetical protein
MFPIDGGVKSASGERLGFVHKIASIYFLLFLLLPTGKDKLFPLLRFSA